MDFEHLPHEYEQYGPYDPVNLLLFIRNFEEFWDLRDDRSDDPEEDLYLVLLRGVLTAVVKIVQSAEDEVARHCNIISRCAFVESEDGSFELLNSKQVSERAKADAEAAVAKERERAERPLKILREKLEGWHAQFGLDPRELVAIIAAFNPCRTPFSGRAEILVKHFGMKGKPSELTPGIMRSITNALAALGERRPEPKLSIEEARELAKQYLGSKNRYHY
jgi:hypothetical protein